MTKSRPFARPLAPRPGPALALALACGLAGCTSAIDMIPSQVGGLPASAPARPEQPPEYPNIYATPAPRETRPLTEAEQKDLEKELSEIRDRQSGARRPPSGRKEPAESTPKNRSP